MYRILIRPEAEVDINQAYRWYEKQSQGLGEDFLQCLEEVFDKIKHHPRAYPTVYKEIKRLLMQRYPYGVFYLLNEQTIIVIALFHVRRNPKQWEIRL